MVILYQASLGVGDKGANVAKTRDKECNGLEVEENEEMVLPKGEIIASTEEEVCSYAKFQEMKSDDENHEHENSKLDDDSKLQFMICFYHMLVGEHTIWTWVTKLIVQKIRHPYYKTIDQNEVYGAFGCAQTIIVYNILLDR